jgi:hypothetical protein
VVAGALRVRERGPILFFVSGPLAECRVTTTAWPLLASLIRDRSCCESGRWYAVVVPQARPGSASSKTVVA